MRPWCGGELLLRLKSRAAVNPRPHLAFVPGAAGVPSELYFRPLLGVRAWGGSPACESCASLCASATHTTAHPSRTRAERSHAWCLLSCAAMGNQPSPQLANATRRAQARAGRLSVTGRFHRLPKKLRDDYIVESTVLGIGLNGEVLQARSRHTGQLFAVKSFKLAGVSKEKKDLIATECENFLAMDHPHVARLVDVYESEDKLHLVMEYMSGGELYQRLQHRKRFSEREAVQAAYDMLCAVQYIHCKGVVHRDLKLENFLFEKEDSDQLKLIDFGSSKLLEGTEKMNLSCGSVSYMAPEVLEKNYTSLCDLWSLGVIIFVLLSGYMPFSGGTPVLMEKIRKGDIKWKPQIWSKISPQACDFVKALLMLDPSQRLTAEAALEHPWIRSRGIPELRCPSISCIDEQIAQALVSFAQAPLFRRVCMNMMAWSLSNEERSKIDNAFLEMDEEHNGSITLSVIQRVLKDKFNMSDDQASKVFDALDANRTRDIRYSEFLAAMVNTWIVLPDRLLNLTFKRLDTDNSGYITIENLREVLGSTFEGLKVEHFIAEVKTYQNATVASHTSGSSTTTATSKKSQASSVKRKSSRHISYQDFTMYLKGELASGDVDGSQKAVDGSPRRKPMNSGNAIMQAANAKSKPGSPVEFSYIAAGAPEGKEPVLQFPDDQSTTGEAACKCTPCCVM